MPIFEYRCKECSTRFEELEIGHRREEPHCPGCSSEAVEKVYSTFAAQGGKANGESFSESPGMCGACGGPGPCAMN